jgi:dTDP-4-dehydrorhamnose 3,5-epimerase
MQHQRLAPTLSRFRRKRNRLSSDPLADPGSTGARWIVVRLLVVKIRELSVPDSFEVSTQIFPDDRGLFVEAYRFDELASATGRPFNVAQVNTSVSRRGVVRGIHYADVPPSQAKYVTVSSGAVLDFVIDIRVGSPTFGEWDSVLLDSVDRRAIFLSEGLGHAFVSLTDDATVTYLVSSVFNPGVEHAITPSDAEIGLTFPESAGVPLLSPKDESAPTLSQAAAGGLLPEWTACREYYQQLREGR